MNEVMTSSQISKAIDRISHEIIEQNLDLDSKLIILGIPTRGAILARRIVERIEKFSELQTFCGQVDVTLYRDDLSDKPTKNISETIIPPEGLDNSTIILVDDVLYTGRSIRSALDSIRDIGRADKIKLAALVDRGHRELPIRADYVGKNIPTSRTEKVIVNLKEIDATEGVFIIKQNEVI